MRGRYPDYDVLTAADALGRGDAPRSCSTGSRMSRRSASSTSREARTLRAFCDVVTGQDCEPRIPVLEMVDAKLHARAPRRLSLPRHAGGPGDLAAGRRQPRRERPRAGCEHGFAAAGPELQHEIVERFSKGELDWDDLPVSKALGRGDARRARRLLLASRGHGTRSASAVRPTRAASRVSAPDSASTGSRRPSSPLIRWPTCRERGLE